VRVGEQPGEDDDDGDVEDVDVFHRHPLSVIDDLVDPGFSIGALLGRHVLGEVPQRIGGAVIAISEVFEQLIDEFLRYCPHQMPPR
jgi:hypothetical protein